MRISEQKYRKRSMQKKYLFPPGLEPGTFRVLGERDNHYTTETGAEEVVCTPTHQVYNKPLHVQLQLMSQCCDKQGASSWFPAAKVYTGKSGRSDLWGVFSLKFEVN